jgi:mannitol 2-dehydrogenase
MVASAINLNNAALESLPIEAPNYDRGSIGVGIAHIGTGHFHRAHQAMYIDRLLRQGLAHEWGI